ncbi:mucin-7-like [Sphaeramia orbicularis]|nr:mucin-7-like [Sphaeramia orbicularis]
MTYEDVKKKQAEKEKSCNLQKSQPPPGPPAPPPPGTSAKWNNETAKDEALAATKDARDFKRVHFNLETLNTRRLLARLAASDAKVGGTKGEGEQKAGPKASRLCENGGPAPSFASLILASAASSSSSSLRSKASAPPPAKAAPPPAKVTPTSAAAAPPSTAVTTPPVEVAPPRPGELEELQEQIDQMRERLRTALARRAEIQTTLAKPTATTATSKDPPPSASMTTTTTTATTTTATNTVAVTVTTTATSPPTVTPVTPLPANTKCVTTMTDPPHKVLSKVRPFHSRLTNERR